MGLRHQRLRGLAVQLGRETSIWAASPKPPVGRAPRETSATTSESEVSAPAFAATSFSALWKHAA